MECLYLDCLHSYKEAKQYYQNNADVKNTTLCVYTRKWGQVYKHIINHDRQKVKNITKYYIQQTVKCTYLNHMLDWCLEIEEVKYSSVKSTLRILEYILFAYRPIWLICHCECITFSKHGWKCMTHV